MKKTAENTAAIATAPFYVDYKQLYQDGLKRMRDALERYDPRVGPAGPYLYYRDHRTVTLHGNRQTGKTHFIRDEVQWHDVVVVHNRTLADTMRHQLKCDAKVMVQVVTATDVGMIGILLKDNERIQRVFIDDALVNFDKFRPYELYKPLIKQFPNLDHFVLVG